MRAELTAPRRASARGFARDSSGSSAVEFALVSIPFLFMLLFIVQIGIYYMAKSSLDAGVTQAADMLLNAFNSGTASSFTGATTIPPTGAQIKAQVVAKSGGMVRNDSDTAVDLRLLTLLSAAALPITDGQVDTSLAATSTSSGSVMVLRAQSKIPVFAPGMGSLAVVRSSAIVRRQSF